MTERKLRKAGRSLTRRVGALVTRCANAVVAPLESFTMPAMGEENLSHNRPVFIVGVPRSGSTLLYQLVTAAFDVGYFTNRHCRWYRAPVFMERCRVTPFGSIDIEFESKYGATGGPHAPSECGNFWYRFLPRRPHTLAAESVGQNNLGAMRRAVAGLTAVVGKPLLFKNLVLSLRIPVLVRAFPEALFIVTHRDPFATAISILGARQNIFGRIDKWFSVRPATCETSDDLGDPFADVVEQVFGTYAEIDHARRLVGEHKFIDVSYDRLCRSPAAELDGLQESLGRRGIQLRRHAGFTCPTLFDDRSDSSTTTPKEWRNRLHEAIARRQTE